MKLSAFKKDIARAESGDWMTNPALPDLEFKVRGRQTIAAKALRAELVAGIPVQDRADRKAMIAHQTRIETEVIIGCLDDWKGLTSDDGQPIPFSDAKAHLTDPDFEDLVAIIGGLCDKVHERRAADIEEAAKN